MQVLDALNPYKFWLKVVACALVIAAFSAATSYVVYIFKDRQQLQLKLEKVADDIERNKQEAQALLAKREQENADLAEKWRNYARESDESYQNKIDHLRAYRNAPGGVRLNAGCGASSSPAGQAATGSAEVPAIASGGSGTSSAVREFVVDESAVATVLEWYAYGLSCHAFVNSK